MFENLSSRLQQTIQQLTGKGRLTEENIEDALRSVRMALLEADVALPVIKDFLETVKARALGAEVETSLQPGQAFIKIVNDELTHVMGDVNTTLDLKAQPPVVVLMAGLQGSGKTTTVAKLARYLINQEKKKVMVVSCDIYRPAAIKQLETLALQLNTPFFPSHVNENPIHIAKSAITAAEKQGCDVLLVDTAGRLHIDNDMMAEIKALHAAIHPTETLFVVDSMTGQDAANTAKAFDNALPLTGVILTKTDGDARGGAALSIRHITGKPIKFLGVGEKIDALEAFYPERMASRILGMGDVVSLVEEAKRKIDEKQAQKTAKKIQKGQFDLQDFQEQIKQMQNMGGLGGLMKKLPTGLKLPQAGVDEKMFSQFSAMIDSMTPQERRYPALIKGSRKVRIAQGSGTQVPDVNRMLKQYMQMEKMLKKFSKKGNMKNMMRQMQGMIGQQGGMPRF
ncbi:MAG: signal recognition particle protein [Gammaproteobacteria bacterium]|jgi:signal recognition particle subunit SRP54